MYINNDIISVYYLLVFDTISIITKNLVMQDFNYMWNTLLGILDSLHFFRTGHGDKQCIE